MSNLQSDPNAALPQPATLDSNSSARSRVAANRQHFQEIAGHLLDHADYNGHGHAAGRQGRAGHTMPPSDAHKQGGSYVPQNMYSQNGSADADDQSVADDYGSVDNKMDNKKSERSYL
jgi:hypothetical protein